jgi:hypothetical protein
MAKKSKPSGKVESTASVKEETVAPVEEETRKKEGTGIDFFYILAAGGILIGVIMVFFLIFRTIFHII